MFKNSEVTVKRQILKLLLQNCSVNDVSLCVSYRSPFNLVAKTDPRKSWLPRLDSNQDSQIQNLVSYRLDDRAKVF